MFDNQTVSRYTHSEKSEITDTKPMDIKRHRDKILDHLQQLYLKESMLLVCEEDFALVIASLFLVYVGRVSMVDIKHILHQKNPKLVLDRKLDEF